MTFDQFKNSGAWRTLVYVYVKVDTAIVFVNEWLVRNGYARIATFPPNIKMTNCFRKPSGKRGSKSEYYGENDYQRYLN